MARLFPRTIGEIVGKAARPIMKKRGFAESSILMQWPHIIGETLSAYTQPLKIQFPRGETTNGTLTIACVPAFAPELQQLTPILLDKLATHLGYKAINRIVIEQHHSLKQPSVITERISLPAENTTTGDPLIDALHRLKKIRNLRDDNATK